MNDHGLSGGGVPADDLTWREQEVLTFLAERLTNREIANRLHLAESTVKDYVGKILSKLYVENRRQAVERAKALGLLDGDRKTTLRPPSNLPAEPTPFVGRGHEKEIGFVWDVINLLYEFARLRVAQDNPEQAAELLALVLQHPASHQARMFEGRIRDSAKGLLAKLEDELSQETFAAALERGQELELDGVIADLVGPKRRR